MNERGSCRDPSSVCAGGSSERVPSAIYYRRHRPLSGGRAARPRLTVSLYLTKVNIMLTHSNFIFSRFFSREYSLLAAAPMGSSLKRGRVDSDRCQGKRVSKTKRDAEAPGFTERFTLPLEDASPVQGALPSALVTLGAVRRAELCLSKIMCQSPNPDSWGALFGDWVFKEALKLKRGH